VNDWESGRILGAWLEEIAPWLFAEPPRGDDGPEALFQWLGGTDWPTAEDDDG